jgi:hypothetical protein
VFGVVRALLGPNLVLLHWGETDVYRSGMGSCPDWRTKWGPNRKAVYNFEKISGGKLDACGGPAFQSAEEAAGT